MLLEREAKWRVLSEVCGHEMTPGESRAERGRGNISSTSGRAISHHSTSVRRSRPGRDGETGKGSGWKEG